MKKTRNIKVISQSGHNYKPTPTIILKGQWLNEMGAGEAWDGEIRVEEYIKKPGIGTALRMMDIVDRVSYEVDETVKRSYGDTFTHRFGIGAFAMPVEIGED